MTIMQNLKRRIEPSLPVPVDLDGLEQHLRDVSEVQSELTRYAPKRQPQAEDIDRAVRTITTFGALPTKEIDDTVLALKEELAEIEADAQRVRNAYVEVTDRLLRHMERQKAVHQIARTAFTAMREQCSALDQPELPFSAPAATPEFAPTTPAGVGVQEPGT